jgi:hypothetical protein
LNPTGNLLNKSILYFNTHYLKSEIFCSLFYEAVSISIKSNSGRKSRKKKDPENRGTDEKTKCGWMPPNCSIRKTGAERQNKRVTLGRKQDRPWQEMGLRATGRGGGEEEEKRKRCQ